MQDFLHIGGMELCTYDQLRDMAVIHCCKSPCYQEGELAATYPTKPDPYIIVDGAHVYINLIDPPEKPLFYVSTFVRALNVIDSYRQRGMRLLFHCNQGQSRSPSVAMLYLHSLGEIATSTYEATKSAMQSLYAAYRPSGGIDRFMRENWSILIDNDVYHRTHSEALE